MSEPRAGVRAKIVAAATELLLTDGRDALTTRAVAAAAGVQAPTIYRLFGDKRGLLDAVADYGFATYLANKEIRAPGIDPVDDLRAGWDLHIGFGLANPALYPIMYGDPQPGSAMPAVAAGKCILDAHVRRIAQSGRLRITEARAADLVHASACGTVLTLLAMPEGERDLGLSETAREAVLAAVTTGSGGLETPGPSSAAIALRAALPDATALSGGERRLLEEWLDRLAT